MSLSVWFISLSICLRVHSCCCKWKQFLLPHVWIILYIYIVILSLSIYIYIITYSTSSLFEQHSDVDNFLISSFHFLWICTQKWDFWMTLSFYLVFNFGGWLHTVFHHFFTPEILFSLEFHAMIVLCFSPMSLYLRSQFSLPGPFPRI